MLRPGGILAFTLRSYYTAYLETLWREFLRQEELFPERLRNPTR